MTKLEKKLDELKNQADYLGIDLEIRLISALRLALKQRDTEIESTNNPFAIDFEHKKQRLDTEILKVLGE